MNQTSNLTQKLAQAQENHARAQGRKSTVYRIYTEAYDTIENLVSRYFQGATIYTATGLWQGERETSVVIEIIGTALDLQGVALLASSIKYTNGQDSVLFTHEPVTRFEV